ncbi:MAG: hypothetical protein RIC06_22490 [Cyclobacteriaceae bacterium]
MKRKLYLVAILVGAGLFAKSQELFTTSYLEKTQVSPKLGIQIGYKLKGGYTIGGFYQKAVELPTNQETKKPRFHEQAFYGVVLGTTLYNHKNVDIDLNVRTGVSNGLNFIITPSAIVDYRLGKMIHLKGGVGVRSFRPTYMAGISIHMF